MTEDGAEKPQVPQDDETEVGQGQRSVSCLQGIDPGFEEYHVAYMNHPHFAAIEQATRNMLADIVLPSTLVESGPSLVEPMFAKLKAALTQIKLTEDISDFNMGACGIVGSYSTPCYARTNRSRHLRVVVTYFDRDEPEKELLEQHYRSLRVAKVAAKWMVRSDAMYVNYSFKPILPARRITFTCELGAPINHSFDALAVRLGLEPKVAQAVAHAEGNNHAPE